VSDISSLSYVNCVTHCIHLSTGSSVAGITLQTSARLHSSASVDTVAKSATPVDHRSIASSKTKATCNGMGITTRLV
jgi:enoyl-[acyl-carrier-protein] reductase (NADH)